MTFDITGSIVLYNNDRKVVYDLSRRFLSTQLSVSLYLIDHSPKDELRDVICHECVTYVHNPTNPGFGAGHNLAVKKIGRASKYHVIINPDIYYDTDVLENIVDYMDRNENIGALMPKIEYPDGTIQYLAKLLPTPLNYIVRRFIPIKYVRDKMNERFELRKTHYDRIIEVPFLSGCFLVFRNHVYNEVKGFDENMFMYAEDIDICRRIINLGYKTIFYPNVSVFHDHKRKSFNDLHIFKIYLRSHIYYFNKWGWVFDRERRQINKRILSQFSG